MDEFSFVLRNSAVLGANFVLAPTWGSWLADVATCIIRLQELSRASLSLGHILCLHMKSIHGVAAQIDEPHHDSCEANAALHLSRTL